MFPFRLPTEFSTAVLAGVAAEDGFFGKVLSEWSADLQEFIHAKLPRIVLIVAIAFFLNKLLQIITRRMARVAEMHAGGLGRIAEIKTLAGVFRATGLAVIGVIAGLQFLDAVGMNLSPLLASAGVAGVAIGLAAQTIVKDMFNGILILVEGQFNVGDSVRLAGLSGTVETMTLRKTTVRDGDGTLYVIPNSQITTVANLSVGYSLATINVSVDFSAHPDRVVELLQQVAMEVRTSEPFKNLFVADPQVLGVDSVKGSQLIYPVVFKTLPMQQYGPMREFQRRVRVALEQNHLLPGDPNRVFSSFGTNDDRAPCGRSDSPAEAHENPSPDPTSLKSQETNPFSGQ
jgi:moderate conductance mechanosensitive channel